MSRPPETLTAKDSPGGPFTMPIPIRPSNSAIKSAFVPRSTKRGSISLTRTSNRCGLTRQNPLAPGRTNGGGSTVKPHLLSALVVVLCAAGASRTASAQTWRFAVAGDSRNCGDVVMPAIAQHVHRSNAGFYWHLGDFRAIYDFDEDYRQAAGPGVNISRYFHDAWPDFIQNQMVPFGDLPVLLSIGNHELVPPKTRPDFLQQFAHWLDAPVIKE